jgi:hypothetical protein
MDQQEIGQKAANLLTRMSLSYEDLKERLIETFHPPKSEYCDEVLTVFVVGIV